MPHVKVELDAGDGAPLNIKMEDGDHTDDGTGSIMDVKIEEPKSESQSAAATMKPQKRIYGPSMKPPKYSFMNPILHEHRRRLVRLIDKLAKRHNWKDASGALSVLLKGTPRGCSVIEDRKHFLVAMELLRRFPNSQTYTKRIRQIYEVWMSKLVWTKKSSKKKHLIQMELALFCLTQGSIREAHNTMKFLVQDRESASDPYVHLIHGVTSYQLWYSELPQEMQLKDFDAVLQPEASSMAVGVGFTQQIGSVGISGGCNTVDCQYAEIYTQCNSESSMGNDKVRLNCNMDTPRQHLNQYLHASEFYMNGSAVTDETAIASPNLVSNLEDMSIFYVHGLDACLLPIKLQQSTEDLEFRILSHRRLVNEHYLDAVKHLRISLYSNPPLFSALHPLIQLLLLGDRVEEALKELEEFSHYFKSILPLRYRARLLECFCSNQYMELAKCYEKILETEPTCVSSLQRLINMHMNGKYSTVCLLEWIAMHLDHTDGIPSIWGEFASCLLKIQSFQQSEYEEDEQSTTGPEIFNYAPPTLIISPRNIPKPFIIGEARRTWIYRCKWWSKRHFNRAIYQSEIQAGAWQLLTSKAACACHLYGPKFQYTREVLSSLQKRDKDLKSILWKHMENSLKLLEALAGENLIRQ
uniref:GTP cyclohydrolase 1 n=1 Tax=Anthurium amnicola TaxID=1678845 RepID=A0A1D1Y228_9ARAE